MEYTTPWLQGHTWRFFYEFGLTANSTLVFRATVAEPVILEAIAVDLHQGQVRLATFAGGTPVGTFTPLATVFNRNRMDGAPIQVNPVTVDVGGTGHSGGVILDALHPRTDGNTNRASSVGDTQQDERGVATGVYYFVLQEIPGSGTSQGIIRGRWEKPPFSYT